MILRRLSLWIIRCFICGLPDGAVLIHNILLFKRSLPSGSSKSYIPYSKCSALLFIDTEVIKSFRGEYLALYTWVNFVEADMLSKSKKRFIMKLYKILFQSRRIRCILQKIIFQIFLITQRRRSVSGL